MLLDDLTVNTQQLPSCRCYMMLTLGKALSTKAWSEHTWNHLVLSNLDGWWNLGTGDSGYLWEAQVRVPRFHCNTLTTAGPGRGLTSQTDGLLLVLVL